jgi:hypothetical protein
MLIESMLTFKGASSDTCPAVNGRLKSEGLSATYLIRLFAQTRQTPNYDVRRIPYHKALHPVSSATRSRATQAQQCDSSQSPRDELVLPLGSEAFRAASSDTRRRKNTEIGNSGYLRWGESSGAA